jgi:hypothetical protein
VTLAEWKQCVDTGACKVRPEDHGWGRGNRLVRLSPADRTKIPSAQRGGMGICPNAVLMGTRSRHGSRAMRRLRPSDRSAGSALGSLGQTLWALRHIRQRCGMGRGLLERLLSHTRRRTHRPRQGRSCAGRVQPD